jgi:hypothetical protein
MTAFLTSTLAAVSGGINEVVIELELRHLKHVNTIGKAGDEDRRVTMS